jgi:GNAT superfamily N-acetyltransferase
MLDHAPLSIRAARMADAAAITALLAELGYPDDVLRVRERLDRLTAGSETGVLVSVVDGILAGVAAYQLMDLLERCEPQCRITALVVSTSARRRGLARALIGAVEAIAVERGCFRLEVTTQPQRPAATNFYLALGFHERPRRLIKPLVTGPQQLRQAHATHAAPAAAADAPRCQRPT